MWQIATVIAEYESTGVVIRYENLGDAYLNYTYNEGMIMLALDLVFFTLIGLWLDKVFPKEFG
jgi:ATP-binding cassette subfamily A (ABC1) protein 1